MKIKGLRWWMVFFVVLGLVMGYLGRSTLAAAASSMMKDTGMTTKEYSYIVIVWQFCFAIMLPISGWIMGILGAKLGFAIFAFAWSLICMATGLANSWQSLAFFRGLTGAAEAAGINAGVKAVTEWFPAKERSVGLGWMNIGYGVGVLLGPPIVIWSLLHGGWQISFVIVGAICFVWSILWVLFYKHPSKSKSLSKEEHEHIIGGQEERYLETEQTIGVNNTSWKKIFANRNTYFICIARFLTEPAWQIFNAWIPLFLMTERGMNIKEVALVGWLPFLTADLGSILGGYLSPFCMKYFNVSMETSRKIVMLFGSLCMIGPACVSLVVSPYAAIGLLCFGGFAHQTLSGALFSIVSDSFGKGEVAAASGFAIGVGFAGAAIFTILFGMLVTTVGYSPMFVVLACFDIAAAIIIWLSVRPYSELNLK